MPRKKVRASESDTIMTHIVLPQDTNPHGNLHGGVMLKLIDSTAGVVAFRYTRSNCVTASIDRTDFFTPVYVGELITLRGRVNNVGKTSMEIGVRAEAEDLITGEIRHVNSAYLTFVCLDKSGKPQPVPELITENENDERRKRQAEQRFESRRQLRKAESE
ncbi:MAG: acyl-CoA thioesterase [Desulfovibrio sp.]